MKKGRGIERGKGEKKWEREKRGEEVTGEGCRKIITEQLTQLSTEKRIKKIRGHEEERRERAKEERKAQEVIGELRRGVVRDQ